MACPCDHRSARGRRERRGESAATPAAVPVRSTVRSWQRRRAGLMHDDDSAEPCAAGIPCGKLNCAADHLRGASPVVAAVKLHVTVGPRQLPLGIWLSCDTGALKTLRYRFLIVDGE